MHGERLQNDMTFHSFIIFLRIIVSSVGLGKTLNLGYQIQHTNIYS